MIPQDSNNLFPYQPRESQIKAVNFIENNLCGGISSVIEMPTGTGKTITSLVPAINFASKKKKKIWYITRTNSQQEQVIKECKKISQKKDVICVPLQGRAGMCHFLPEEPCTPEELSLYCRDRRKDTIKWLKSEEEGLLICPYYANTHTLLENNSPEKIFGKIPEPGDLLRTTKEEELCPYMISKKMIKKAHIIVSPYIFFLDPGMRKNILEEWQADESDIILIIDEAHNFPEYSRDVNSVELSHISIERALSEIKKWGDGLLLGNITISEFVKEVLLIINEAGKKYCIDGEALIPRQELTEGLMLNLGITTNHLNTAVLDMISYGERIMEELSRKKKVPRSYVRKLGNFLYFWINDYSESHARLIKESNGKYALESYCIDPSMDLQVMNNIYSSIHLSGTLSPIDEYCSSIGLNPQKTETIILPSPYPEENLFLMASSDITTRYEELVKDDEAIEKIASCIRMILKNTKVSTAVFFPGYSLMEKILGYGIREDIPRNIFVMSAGLLPYEFSKNINTFKEKGGVMFSVMGGRVSEGMDFPGKFLEMVIIAGIPYPPPTARQKCIERYYEAKFGRGWEYGYRAPALRKISQSIGRLIRSENDKGVAVILDYRIMSMKKELGNIKQFSLNDINIAINEINSRF